MPKKPKGIKFLTRCRLALSHLRQHVFKQSFQDTVNPICRCSNDIETTVNYLLHYYYCNEKLTLLKKLRSVGIDSEISQTLLSSKRSLNVDFLDGLFFSIFYIHNGLT